MKLLAAQRSCVKTVLIPRDNKKDLTEIPEKVKTGLEIVTIETINDAIRYAFSNQKNSKSRNQKSAFDLRAKVKQSLT